MFEFEKKTRNAHDGPFRCPLLQILLTLINPQGWLIVLKGLLTLICCVKNNEFQVKNRDNSTQNRTNKTKSTTTGQFPPLWSII